MTTQNSNCDKPKIQMVTKLKLKIGKILKLKFLPKTNCKKNFKKSNCDKTKKNSNFDKFKNSNCESKSNKTQLKL